MRRAAVLVVLLVAVAASSAGPAEAALAKRKLLGGLDEPVQVTSVKGDSPGRLYVVLRKGVIRVYRHGSLRREPFLDIRRLVSDAGLEQGLLSVAFSPGYLRNRYFYVDYTNASGDTRVVRYRSDGAKAIPSSRKVLVRIDQPYANHNGGQLQFGPDRLLYVGTGDGGSACDPGNRAQNLSSRLGKLLTLDTRVAGSTPQVAAYGLRNPWRFLFDRATGELYLGDVGQNAREEVDWLPNPRPSLVNFGWNVFEGDLRDTCPGHGRLNRAAALKAPVAVYGHDVGCSITGGYVYRGKLIPRVRGWYLYGDWCSGRIWRLKLSGGRLVRGPRLIRVNAPGLSSFGEGPRGALYMTSLNGQLYKLTGS